MAVGFKTGGKKKGSKNKATIARELQAAQQIWDAQGKSGREPALATLERLLGDLDRFKAIAEGAASLHKPPTQQELEKAATAGLALAKGDWDLFGEWFDRAVGTTRDAAKVAKDLAKFQAPEIKAVDAPAPPPDPRDVDQRSRKRFGLRVFEGGKPLEPSAA